MIESVPWKSPPMYSWVGLRPPVNPGRGPSRLARELRSFAVGHIDRLAVARQPDRRGIPADRDKAQRCAPARILDVDDGQVVGVGVGNEQHRLIRRESQRIGRAARVAPWGRSPCRSSRSDLPASVSITLTVLRLALATNRILPPFASNISLGWSSVVQWPMTLKVPVLMTATLALLQRLT